MADNALTPEQQRFVAENRANFPNLAELIEIAKQQYPSAPAPAPQAAPAPSPVPTSQPPQPVEAAPYLTLNGNNSSYDYRYRSTFGNTDVTSGFRMTYNGVPVVYVPRDWAEKGSFVNDTQYYSPAYLNKDLWQYMKPAQLESGAWNETIAPRLSGWVSDPNSGYIIDEQKFKEYNLALANQTPRWTSLGKPNPPISGIGEDNGKLVYIGKSGDDLNGELAIFRESGPANLYVHQAQSSFWGKLGRSIGKLGPATLMLNAVVPGLGTAVYAGTNVGQAISTGNWGRAALNIALTSVPGADGASAAKGTIFEIPAIADSVKTVASTLGVSAATAGMIVDGAMNLVANGGNLENALRTTLAQQVGGWASNYASQLAGLQGMKGLDSILRSVTKDSTAALLLNQDVESAGRNAFIGSAVPFALESTPGWGDLSASQRSAITNAAVSAAKGGQMDVGSALRNFTSQVFADAAVEKVGGSLTESQKQLARQSIMAGMQGKPLDSALQNFLVGEAKVAINNQVAQAEGWKDAAQKQQAVSLYGSKVNPNEYVAKQQGWEDYAEKQAALKSYGENITPVGFKEREQVKGIDPLFDAEAYAKLNEVAGDPYRHFLEQGQKAALPTSYEKGAESALASLGYKADASEIKQVADLFKSSASPDAALGKYYDERWVTPEEAALAAKDAGFNLTPEQLSKFTGQARGGEKSVFEDIATAASIGKAAQQQRETFINNYLSDVTKAYKEQGYTDAEIAAAMPDIRSRVNDAAEQNVKQLDDYAAKTKAAYGADSPEYAAAQKKLLETKSAIGGYGVVQEGNQFKSLTGDSYRSDAPTAATSWRGGTQSNWSGVYDESGREYTIGDYLKLSPGAKVFDQSGNPITLGAGMAFEIAGTQPSEIGAIAQIGKTSEEQLLPGPLEALFGGQAGGGGKTGTGFSLIGRTGSGEPVYGQAGSDFSLITMADGTTKAVNPKTQEVYLVPPQKIAELLPKAPTLPQEKVPQTVEEIIKAADEKRISPQEAQKALEAAMGTAGYQATPEEIQKQAAMLQGEKTPEQLQAEAERYIGERMVTADEVRQMYRDLGLQQPTEADITRFTGQRMQAEVPDALRSYLPTASANVISLQAQQDAERKKAVDAQIAGLTGSTQAQFGDVNARITQLQQQGLSQAEATSKALQELSSGQAGLGQQIGAVQTGLGQQIGGLGEQVGGLGQALAGLAGAMGTKTQGLQQQIQQAQQQANFGNLLTLIGVAEKEQKPPPLELVGKITPYDFSTDLLAGIYKPNTMNAQQANEQLLNLTRGLS